jgi:hypothetical protein
MMTLPPSVKIYVATQPVDARKSFDGLAALVQAEFGLEPLSGHMFAFINRRGHVIQLLFWERSGFCIVKKRAVAFTLVDGCLALGLDPYPYLVDVIDKLERGWPLRRLRELIPHRWASQQAAQKGPEQT